MFKEDFFADSFSKMGHQSNMKHFDIAYDCLKFFVDEEDIQLKSIELVEEYHAEYFACQMSHGDTDAMFALSGGAEGLLGLAGYIAEEEFEAIDEDSYDAICEFTNMVNGKFSGYLEDEDVEVDTLPPMCCENCHITANGKFCVLHMSINGNDLNLISVVDIIPYMS